MSLTFTNDAHGVPLLTGGSPPGAAGIAEEARAALLSTAIGAIAGKADLTGANFTGAISTKNTTEDTLLSFFATSGKSNVQASNATNTVVKPLLLQQYGGNVGIETSTATTAKLVIGGTVPAQGIDLSTYDQYLNCRVIQNTHNAGDHDLFLGFNGGATDGSKIHLYSNGSETMRVTAGKVGIGTASPAYTLDVAGTIHSTNVNTGNVTVQGTGNADFAIRSGDGASYFDFYAQYGVSRFGMYDAVYGTVPFTIDGGVPSGMFHIGVYGIDLGGNLTMTGNLAVAGTVTAGDGSVICTSLTTDSSGGMIQAYDHSGNPTWNIDGSGLFSGSIGYASTAGSASYASSASTADFANAARTVDSTDSASYGAGAFGFDPNTGHFYGHNGTSWLQLDN
jgi:hypothetical protein